MKLTHQQLAFFHTFGYIGIPQFFTPAETKWIIDGFEESIQKFGGGTNHDGSKRTSFGGPIEHTHQMCTLLDHPRVVGALSSLIGDDFNYCSGDGNYYSGDTPWHPDGSWNRLWAIKAAFYLDPVRKDTGCLRVIPNSQDPQSFLRRNMEGWNNKADPNKALELYGVLPRDYPGNVPLETNPGDLVIFNHDIYHAAFGGSNRRRMFTMNCTRRAHTPEELKIAREYLSVHSPGGYKIDTGAGMYFPTMVKTASPARWKHLQQPAEIHDAMFPQYALNAPREKPIEGHAQVAV